MKLKPNKTISIAKYDVVLVICFKPDKRMNDENKKISPISRFPFSGLSLPCTMFLKIAPGKTLNNENQSNPYTKVIKSLYLTFQFVQQDLLLWYQVQLEGGLFSQSASWQKQPHQHLPKPFYKNRKPSQAINFNLDNKLEITGQRV